MPQLPLAPSCLRIRVLGKINSANIAHIFHATYGSSGPPSASDATAISLAFRNAFSARFASVLPGTVTYSTFEVTDLSSLTGVLGTTTTSVTGSVAIGAGVLNSACVVVSWKQGLRYRGGHPRTYFPYGSATGVGSGNTLPAALVTAMKTAAQSFVTDVAAITSGSTTIQLCAVSYYSKHVLRPLGVPLVITTADVHNRVDTQRRRLGKEF